MNKLILLPILFSVIACDFSRDVDKEKEYDPSVLQQSLVSSEDPELDQLRIDFTKACLFSQYTCKLMASSHVIYREADTHMPIAVIFGANPGFPESWVARWCANTTPSKVHVDYVRYPEGQSTNRVWACVMDDYSPGAE